MTASPSDNAPHGCQAGSTPPALAEREMPVLFRLMDVNRPTGAVAEATAPAGCVSQHPELQQPEPEPQAIVEVAPRCEPPATATPELATSETAQEAPASQENAAPTLAALDQAIAESRVEPSVTEHQATPLSPQERAALREQRRQSTQPRGDWLTSHGKLLAMGFVAALAITIYAARTNRKPAVVAGPVVEWPAASPGDVANHLPESQPSATSAAPALAAPSSTTEPATPSGEASPALIAETSPATPAEKPVEPRVDLLAPTVPTASVAETAAPAGQNAQSENLFPWKNGGDERVASRPETPADVAATPAAAAPATPAVAAPAPAPAAASAPAAAPGATSAPPTSAPQYQYPQTNYQGLSQPLPPLVPPANSPQAGNVGGGQFVPSDSSAPVPPVGGYQ